MISLHYYDESKRKIQYEMNDWDAVRLLADSLRKCPAYIVELFYCDGDDVGIFDLESNQIY